MIKKPRKWEATPEDADFISTEIREYSLAPPSYFDETIEKLKDILTHPQAEPGLTVVEFILRRLEKEAKKILREYGYPTDITELVPWLRDDDSFMWTDPESGNTYFHEIPSIQALSAKQVLSSVDNIRDWISMNDAEETAIETMRLLFAAMNADLRDTIMDGMRTNQRRKDGGRADKSLKAVSEVIRKIISQKGMKYQAKEIWKEIEATGTDGVSVQVSNETYIVYIDGEKIVQKNDKTGRDKQRKFSTFLRYVTNVKNYIKNSQ
jgi:hypothetical protein